MKKIYKSLYAFDGNLNLNILQSSCKDLYEKVKFYSPDDHWYNNDGQPNAPSTTKSLLQYNVFTFVLPELHKLYKLIQENFYIAEKDYYSKNLKCNYYIQSWLNVYKPGEFLDWHSHNYMVARGWHGFYCIDTEPSSTLYKFDNGDMINVECKNNMLVIGLCDNNQHKSESWNYFDRNRITIAFDIIPEQGLKSAQGNHWIPI